MNCLNHGMSRKVIGISLAGMLMSGCLSLAEKAPELPKPDGGAQNHQTW